MITNTCPSLLFLFPCRKPYAVYWECSRRRKDSRCNASVIERDGTFTRENNNHIHEPVLNAATNIQMQATVRKKAKENIFQSAAVIVQDVILEYVDDSEPNPDAPTSSNMEWMTNRNRQCLRPEDPKTLEFELDQTNIQGGFFQNDIIVKDR